MADIQRIDLSFQSTGSGQVAIVEAEISFSLREVADDYQYGVNAAIIRPNDDALIIPRHRGMTAMSLATYPTDALVGLSVGSGNMVIQPGGQANVAVTLTCGMREQVPSGEQLKAVVTVIPEIAATSYFSRLSSVP